MLNRYLLKQNTHLNICVSGQVPLGNIPPHQNVISAKPYLTIKENVSTHCIKTPPFNINMMFPISNKIEYRSNLHDASYSIHLRKKYS